MHYKLKIVPLEERIVFDAAAIADAASIAAHAAIDAAENPTITSNVIFVDQNSLYDQISVDPLRGSSWETAFTSLAKALDYANDPLQRPGIDQIWVAEGTYIPETRVFSAISQSASFSITENVAIYGGFNGTESLVTEANSSLYKTVLSGDLSGNDGNANDFTSPTFDFSVKTDNAWHVVRNSTATSVLISGVTIVNGFAGVTGGVVGGHGGNPMINPTILDARGAGVFNLSAVPNTFTLDHVTLQDNVAILKTGIQSIPISGNLQVRGAAVYSINNGTFNISDSLIQNNYVFNDKAFAAAAVNVESTNITANSTVNIINTTFHENTADSGPGFVAGFGALNATVKTLYIGDSIFSSNNAVTFRGGAIGIFPRGTASFHVIDNSLFLDNHAALFGGAIVSDGSAGGAGLGTIVLFKDNFINNSAGLTGGAYTQGGWMKDVYIDQSNFIGNTASAGGAVDISGSALTRFNAPTNPTASTATITDSHFIDNVATGAPINPALFGFAPGSVLSTDTGLYGGGAILLQAGVVGNVIDSRFVNNTAPNGGAISAVGYGAIIRVGAVNNPVSAGATLNVSNSDFVNNQAEMVDYATPNQVTGDGGAISSKGWLFAGLPIAGPVITNVTDSTFTNNRADRVGGTLAAENSTLSFIGNISRNNDSTYGGGGMSLITSTATITGNTFYKSNDSDLGDQFYLDSSIVNTYNSDNLSQVTSLINSLKNQIQNFVSDDIYFA